MTIADCWREWCGSALIVAIAMFLPVAMIVVRRIKDERRKLNVEELWVAVGIVAIILSGRYVFFMIPVSALILGMLMSRISFKHLGVGVLTVFVFLVGLNSLVNRCSLERESDAKTKDFLNMVALGEDDFVVADDSALTWTVLWRYYPQVMNCRMDDWLDNFDSNISNIKPEQHWLFCHYGMNDHIFEVLNEKGLKVESVYTGQLGMMDGLEVYRVETLEH